MERKSMSRQFGMSVRGGLRSGDTPAHYQNMIVEVDHVIDDPVYGAGVVGYNLYTGKEVVVFSNPVVSEQKAKFPNAKFMKDWVAGLNLMGRRFSLGKGAIALFMGNVIKGSMRTRQVDINGATVGAAVYFCQWIKCWRSAEAAVAGGEGKDIMVGYGVAVPGERKSSDGSSLPVVKIHFFQPQGPDNRFNKPGYDYPVVFSAKNLDEALEIVERECSERLFTHFMTRIIDDQTGAIVGQGYELSMYAKDSDAPFSEIFAQKLAFGLNLTRSGLEQLVAAEGFTFQFFGMHAWTCSFVGDSDGGKSLTDEVLNNKVFLPRDENGNIIAKVAVPVAIRTSFNNGNTWINPIKAIGYSGIKEEADGDIVFSEESEIIAADSYDGKPIFDDKGKQVERGLDRTVIPFETDSEQGNTVEANSMFTLASILGCAQMRYPSGQKDYAVFMQEWDDTGKPFPRYTAQPVQQPQQPQQPQQAPQQAPQQPQPASVQPAQPAPQQAPVQQPVQPARQPVQPAPQQTVQQPVQQPQAQPAATPRRAARPAPQTPQADPNNTPNYPTPFGSEDVDFDDVPF